MDEDRIVIHTTPEGPVAIREHRPVPSTVEYYNAQSSILLLSVDHESVGYAARDVHPYELEAALAVYRKHQERSR